MNHGSDHSEFLKKEKEIVKEMNEFKEKLAEDYLALEKNIKDLIDDTHKEYNVGYAELQSTIMDIKKKQFGSIPGTLQGRLWNFTINECSERSLG